MGNERNEHKYLRRLSDEQFYHALINYSPHENEDNTYGMALSDELLRRGYGSRLHLEQKLGIITKPVEKESEQKVYEDSAKERVKARYTMFLLEKYSTIKEGKTISDKVKRKSLYDLFRHRETKKSIEKAGYQKINLWYGRMSKQAQICLEKNSS